ncbi:probable inactive histone-lysine N-methyltransferase SUVR2 isoform X2 [Phoenix dactylifera]|uniref:Probable inactive histone-lysine N-methyltransferase SUVR2 isoform X2 n=1 Tax=Phoenix dactylifera TaxID=42345 RepID=A0A8B8ZFU7_PHODC|nr:probable inactive histone-lysine N-methyltransferase SUVR2 isoform X2 [Phoenix dactylifera]
MALKPQIAKALNAMKDIGIPVHTTKPVLKKLLQVYENNWEYIEAENYRVLADAILDLQESKDKKSDPAEKQNDIDVGGRRKVATSSDETENYRKKLRTRQEEQGPSTLMQNSEIHAYERPKKEDISPESHTVQQQVEPASHRTKHRGKWTELPSSEPSSAERSEVVPPPHSMRSERPGQASSQKMSRVSRALMLAHNSPGSAERTEVVPPPHSMRSERPGQASSPKMSRVSRDLMLAHNSRGQGNAKSSSHLTYRRDKHPVNKRMEDLMCCKEPKVKSGTVILPAHGTGNCHAAAARQMDGPTGGQSLASEVPLAMICPPVSFPAIDKDHRGHRGLDGSSKQNGCASQKKASETLATQHADRRGKRIVTDAADKNISPSDLLSVQEKSSTNVEIASSAMGEVKLSFTCDTGALDRPDFHMPSMEAVCKMVEDKCLRSYKIFDRNFSLMNIMKEMCRCFLELGSESSEDREENIIHIVPTLESLKRSGIQHMLGNMPACPSKGPNGHCLNVKIHENNVNARAKKQIGECSNISSRSLVVVPQPEIALGDLRPAHDVNDVTKGEERVRISIVNEVNSEQYPPSFFYIPHNIVYQNAYINLSLARIGDESCCSDCFGDCLAARIPCACAGETGGEFAYTRDGLLRKDFLDACISMHCAPQKHHYFYCKDCPLERSKNEVGPDPCKGHLLRKFIKECWSKCGCKKECGNRVVQRGITCNLQVFFTGQRKGWGLRTLDELPRGTFVCEYVGEILTNMELYDRTIQTTGNAKHTYPVLMDADWGTEGVLKDEEALCLDATFYGNVARFINHRTMELILMITLTQSRHLNVAVEANFAET